MSKHIQLSIDDPCHENWDNMTPADKGRFCASCQKQVIDFTNLSDSRVAAFFRKPIQSLTKDGSVCGRFYQDQLDRDIETPKKRIPWIKYFFQFALPAFFMSSRAIAQGGVGLCIKNASTVITPSKFTGNSRPDRLGNDIAHGKVINADNNPVPFASIMIKGGKEGLGVSADSSGVFSLKDMTPGMDILLEISSAGYETKKILINKGTDLTKNLIIQLDTQVMEEVIVTGYPVTKERMILGGAISIITVSKKSNIPIAKSPEEIPSMIKVYPNPVVSGMSINIGCQKLQEGYYAIQLSSQSGQQVLNKQTWIDGEIQVLNIDIPAVAAGIYFLKLTNKETNKRFTQKIIVQ